QAVLEHERGDAALVEPLRDAHAFVLVAQHSESTAWRDHDSRTVALPRSRFENREGRLRHIPDERIRTRWIEARVGEIQRTFLLCPALRARCHAVIQRDDLRASRHRSACDQRTCDPRPTNTTIHLLTSFHKPLRLAIAPST